MNKIIHIRGVNPDDLITGKLLEEIMTNEEMLLHKPARSMDVKIEEWSPVVLQVRLIDGCPFVCDQNGLPIIGQKDISVESKAGGLPVFTASFRSLSKEYGSQE